MNSLSTTPQLTDMAALTYTLQAEGVMVLLWETAGAQAHGSRAVAVELTFIVRDKDLDLVCDILQTRCGLARKTTLTWEETRFRPLYDAYPLFALRPCGLFEPCVKIIKASELGLNEIETWEDAVTAIAPAPNPDLLKRLKLNNVKPPFKYFAPSKRNFLEACLHLYLKIATSVDTHYSQGQVEGSLRSLLILMDSICEGCSTITYVKKVYAELAWLLEFGFPCRGADLKNRSLMRGSLDPLPSHTTSSERRIHLDDWQMYVA